MIEFKLNVGKGNPDYYIVNIFNSASELHGFFDMGENYEAITHTYELFITGGKQSKRLANVGSIGFYKGNISPKAVSHEMVHAANHYWKNQRRDWNLGKSDKSWALEDELHASLVGYLVEQFYNKYNNERFGTK